MTDPTPTEEANPMAIAILAKPAQYGWSLRYGKADEAVIYSSSWPKSEAAVAAMKKAFGPDATIISTHQEAVAHRDWNPASAFVQALVRDGNRLERPSYLRKIHSLNQSAGMRQFARADMTLDITWSAIGYGLTAIPRTMSSYLKVKVQWFDEGTVLLHCEDVDSKTDDIHSLYVYRGCEHEYEHRSGGNCYHIHTCKHCGHRYDIDSGD